MIYIIISCILFLITVTSHIIISRLIRSQKKQQNTSIIIFGSGLLMTYFLLTAASKVLVKAPVGWLTMPLILNSLIIYLILTSVYLIYFLNAIHGEGSPASEIYLLLTRKKKANLEQILARFSDKNLIIKRLDDMVNKGLVTKKNNRYIINSKGLVLVKIFGIYRKLSGWQS